MKEKISLIIPAFNEEKQIEKVILAAKQSPLLTEIIVVDDGSTDQTRKIVKGLDVKLVELKINQGKASAMEIGIKESGGEIVLFLDADLIDLKSRHIKDLVQPLLDDPDLSMSLGVFRNSGWVAFLGNGLFPHISGQRALRKADFKRLKLVNKGYGAEIAISKYVWKNNLRYKKIPLTGLRYLLKEEKSGIWEGILYRVKMYYEILKELFN